MHSSPGSTRPVVVAPTTQLHLRREDGPDGVPLLDRYVDRYWLPFTGPSSIVLARLVLVEAGRALTASEISLALGMGPNCRRLVGAIDRARQFKLLTFRNHVLTARSSVRLLDDRHIEKLPPFLRGELVTSGFAR